MDIMNKALKMLKKYPLCDHCLGRQFALLGHGLENDDRGNAIKLVLTLMAHASISVKKSEGLRLLEVLATNGFSEHARNVLETVSASKKASESPTACYLCENKFTVIQHLVKKALSLLNAFEYSTFLVGTELPPNVAEREDELRARFAVGQGENMRNEFGRVIGKAIAKSNGKSVDFKKPEIVVLVNPFSDHVWLQVNPLFVSGRYRKLARGLPQSRWLCSECRGRGCKKCKGTGKMYAESVQELIEGPFLKATDGTSASFHASGREDIDARMLGKGRPFVIEIAHPKKRFIDLKSIERDVNVKNRRKIEVSDLRHADKDNVRRLKKGESTQKEYSVMVEFEKRVAANDLRFVRERLMNALVKQQTPLRVLHRRADLTREKYIYEVNVKRLSPRKAQLKIRCQGGLYVKELVTGDEGRTLPNISQILGNKAKPLKLDVLNIIMDDTS